MLKFIVHQNAGCAKSMVPGCGLGMNSAALLSCAARCVNMCRSIAARFFTMVQAIETNSETWNIYLRNKAQGPGGSRLLNTTPQHIETTQKSTASAVPKIYPCDSGSRPTRATQPAKMKSNSSVEGLFESLSGYCHLLSHEKCQEHMTIRCIAMICLDVTFQYISYRAVYRREWYMQDGISLRKQRPSRQQEHVLVYSRMRAWMFQELRCMKGHAG